jgi:hypothetical protein
VEYFKELITGECDEPIFEVASELIDFHTGPIWPGNDGYFDAARCRTPKGNLCCESSTETTVSWRRQLREAFEHGALATETSTKALWSLGC